MASAASEGEGEEAMAFVKGKTQDTRKCMHTPLA